MTTLGKIPRDAAISQDGQAGLPSVTSNHGERRQRQSERQHVGRELRRLAARIGLDSERKIADAIGEDRGMVGRVLDGDETVSARKWETVEGKIRGLDEEMGSERSEGTAKGQHEVSFRLKGNFGVDLIVSGPVSDMAALEASVARLMRQMGQVGQTGQDEGPEE
jgi:hypothetical protein